MTILQLNTEFASTAWKRAFAEELIRRIPDINPDAADEVADAQYLLYSHRSPACTAAEYAQADRLSGDQHQHRRAEEDQTGDGPPQRHAGA